MLEWKEPQPTHVHACSLQEVQRKNSCACRVPATDGDGLFVKLRKGANASISPHEDLRLEVAVNVAHANHDGSSLGLPPHAHMGKGVVVRDVDVPPDKRLDLPFVGREKRKIERNP